MDILNYIELPTIICMLNIEKLRIRYVVNQYHIHVFAVTKKYMFVIELD
ncbi:hypothetical protein NIES4106_22940 [Fischerella sp. NIES-4106]|nr:hypothetical protein NIES4106_22940 [Fischerella sp. NIES-4106]